MERRLDGHRELSEMSNLNNKNYYFLNVEGHWPGFHWSGLELSPSGTLGLATVPMLKGTLPPAVKTAAAPDGPGGMAIDAGRTLYFSDPENNRVRRILGCDGSVAPAPCMEGSRGVSGLDSPRGLLIPATRPSLFVADSGNHRIQVFDLDSFQLVEIWGQSNLSGAPQPGSAPGQFNTPWTLAGDSAGNVYVVDYGNKRVQKFSAAGQLIPSFCTNLQASALVQQPGDIAVQEINDKLWIFVVDIASAGIFIFDSDGNPILDSLGHPRRIRNPQLTKPLGIAVSATALYIGDNAANQVFRFLLNDTFDLIGPALGYSGPVAALLLDSQGDLWIHPGGSLTPIMLQATKGYGSHGSLWIGSTEPVEVPNRCVVWHRLQALTNRFCPGAHLDMYAYAASDLNNAPAVDPSAPNPFADPKWKPCIYRANADLTDLFIGGEKAKYLWVGALLSGDGTATVRLHQLRVEYDHQTYDQFLPAIYHDKQERTSFFAAFDPGVKPPKCEQFLIRLLSLFESFFGGVEDEIRSLPKLFDPFAAPKSFLAWLAGCMGLQLDEKWNEEKQRRIIAEIFRLSGLRGTAVGLRETLRVFAGVDAKIVEPILNAAWWALPSSESDCCPSCAAAAASSLAGKTWTATENSVLGWTTMLAPAQPQGAVVGTSADLDQSDLISDEDFGAPLFTDVAFQFAVWVYRSQMMCPDALARIRALVDQEKPVHTSYHVCVIDPLFRVGFQSRLGIDTVVGGPPRSLALGTGQALGEYAALAGPPPSLIGADSRLGVSMRLA
jgi:phage tail-like protein